MTIQANITQRKALFLPSYLGGGFGHISRCLALAETLADRGWQAAFAMAGSHAGRVRQAGYPVFWLRRPFQPAPSTKTGPAYTVIGDLNYQLVRDGLTHPRAILACVAEQLRVVHQFKPDVLIADTWPLASVLAHLTGLPLVQIIRSATHPAGEPLLWWQSWPEGLTSPDPKPVFNPVLDSLGIAPVQRAEDLLVGDLYLVPSLPELGPLPDGLPNTHYVGPFVRNQAKATPGWLEQMDGTVPLVYATAGGGASSVGGMQFYQSLIEALRDEPVQVILSTGAHLNPAELPSSENIRIEAWVPGPAVIERSRLVVFTGGYGTTMEMVRAGVPGLVIPSHTEQESNARRLEAAGAGKVLLPGGNEMVQVWHRWPGGRFTTLIQPQWNLAPARLKTAVLSALEDPSLVSGAERLKRSGSNALGTTRAADLIEELFASPKITSERGWDRLSIWKKLALQR